MEPGNPRSGTAVIEPSSRDGNPDYGSMVRPAALSGLKETDGEPVRPHFGGKGPEYAPLATRLLIFSLFVASCPLSQGLRKDQSVPTKAEKGRVEGIHD